MCVSGWDGGQGNLHGEVRRDAVVAALVDAQRIRHRAEQRGRVLERHAALRVLVREVKLHVRARARDHEVRENRVHPALGIERRHDLLRALEKVRHVRTVLRERRRDRERVVRKDLDQLRVVVEQRDRVVPGPAVAHPVRALKLDLALRDLEGPRRDGEWLRDERRARAAGRRQPQVPAVARAGRAAQHEVVKGCLTRHHPPRGLASETPARRRRPAAWCARRNSVIRPVLEHDAEEEAVCLPDLRPQRK